MHSREHRRPDRRSKRLQEDHHADPDLYNRSPQPKRGSSRKSRQRNRDSSPSLNDRNGGRDHNHNHHFPETRSRKKTSPSRSPQEGHHRRKRHRQRSRSRDRQRGRDEHRRSEEPHNNRGSDKHDKDEHRSSNRSSRRRRRRRNRDRRSESSYSEKHGHGHRAPDTPRAGVVSDDEDVGAAKKTKVATRSSSTHDDTTGHFQYVKGTTISDRYRIIREVGLGTFGRVVECLDHKHANRQSGRHDNNLVAIKIVRNVKRYYESALIEASIVGEVNRRGGRGLTHCAIMHESFTLDKHLCMVFENLGPSLYDWLKQHKYKPFPMVCIQDFTVQLLETLEFLHHAGLIHTDLKIENVLLMNDREVTYGHQRVPESTRIKVIDFGGACYDNDKKSSLINTRQYRAPEVILETGWSMPSDMWSAGCILAELYQGELLFSTHDNLEHLALIERMIGPFPRRMLKKAKNNSELAREAFDSNNLHRMDRVLPAGNASYVEKSTSLETIVHHDEDSWFLSLLRKILVIDPKERATAYECLQYLSRIRRNAVRYN